METMLFYLLKASGLLAVFFVAYYFLLRKETFFKSNRWFLLLGLVTSIALPLVTFKKIVWIETVAPQLQWTDVSNTLIPTQNTQGFEIDWWLVFGGIYAIGMVIFLLKFVFDFSGLLKALKGKTVTQQADFKFIDVEEKVSPFSYFNYIVYNSSMYSETELKNILEHEKVHCEQHHSIDVLIVRIFSILFWYNPFVWLYQKAILQNLEFIADSDALKNIAENRGEMERSVAKKAYQITLLKVTTHDNCVAITNHFFQSLIKKRIIMLNKNQSKPSRSWKYFLIIPALAAFLFYFQVKVIAQEKYNPLAVTDKLAKTSGDIIITKNTTDAELKTFAEEMKTLYNAKLKFSKIKRNSTGEIISIKADYSDKDGHKATYVIAGEEPIKPINISRKDNGSIAFGNTNSKQLPVFSKNGSPILEEDIDTIVSADTASEDHYAYEMPEAPEAPELPELEELSQLDDMNIVVKTIGKNGRMKVIVNGEVIDIDPDKIMADIDVKKIKEQAQKSIIIAKNQMKAARPQMERARKQAAESRRNSGNAQQDADEAREEMEQAREEMEQSKRELEEARNQLERSKAEFERQKEKAEIKKTIHKK